MVGVMDGVVVGLGVDVAVGTLVAVAVAVGCAATVLQELAASKQTERTIRYIAVFIASNVSRNYSLFG